jgi:hypothetical protein
MRGLFMRLVGQGSFGESGKGEDQGRGKRRAMGEGH